MCREAVESLKISRNNEKNSWVSVFRCQICTEPALLLDKMELPSFAVAQAVSKSVEEANDLG